MHTCGVARSWAGATARAARLAISVAAVALSAPQRAHAQEQVPGVECCLETLIPTGSRTVGLGQALTARPGKDGMFINPAGLSDTGPTELIIHRSSIGESPMTTFSLLIHSPVAGSFGLTYRLIDFGGDDATDENGNKIGTTGTLNQILIASYATTLGPRVRAGLNYRLFNMKETCTGLCGGKSTSGTTPMIDIGFTYQPGWLKTLVLGASLMQAGLKLQVNNASQSDVTPKRLRLGAAYDVAQVLKLDTTVAVWTHLDAVKRLNDPGSVGVNGGVEVILDRTIFFRAGYASSSDGTSQGGAAVGLGLIYQRFDVNVAKSVTTSELFPEPFSISFGISF